MIAALIIAASLVVVGAILYVHDRITRRQDDTPSDQETPQPQAEEGCCGMHLTCEKDSLSTAISDEIIYYEDEELDAYRGRRSDSYDDAETEEFRDILLTLMPADIAGWARSLQLRGIEMPPAVKDELLMIVAEARASR